MSAQMCFALGKLNLTRPITLAIMLPIHTAKTSDSTIGSR